MAPAFPRRPQGTAMACGELIQGQTARISMPAHSTSSTRASRASLLMLTLVGTAVFALGLFIGYHSVYRDISVAALHGPHSSTGL
jgi:hypothetical protein